MAAPSTLSDLQVDFYGKNAFGTRSVVADQKANATATATVTAAATETAYLDQVIVGGLGATSATVVNLTIAGAVGNDISLPVTVPAGATLALTTTVISFNPPLAGAALGDDITVTLGAFGAGNTRANLVAIGHIV